MNKLNLGRVKGDPGPRGPRGHRGPEGPPVNIDIISQAEAEAGVSSEPRTFTAQRVRQAIVAWFNGISGALGRTILTRTTAAQVRADIGLGTAATKDVGEAAGNVMPVGAFGLGAKGTTMPKYSDAASLPERTGFYLISDGHPSVENGKPSLADQYNSQVLRIMRHVHAGYCCDIYFPYFYGSRGIVVANRQAGKEYTSERLLWDSVNTLNIGANKTTALKALNLTQQEKAIIDPSGLWVESGALTNDMSSYLSSKTYAEMRTKLGVAPVNVVQATGTSTEDVMSQKATTDALNTKADLSHTHSWSQVTGKPIVQTTGTSTTDIMSQKAVTDALAATAPVATAPVVVAANATVTLTNGRAVYAVNTTSAARTLTLPANPPAGATVTIIDYANTCGTNRLTIARNGINIEGAAANAALTQNGQRVEMVYIDAAQGWKVISSYRHGGFL